MIGVAFALGAGCDKRDVSLGSDLHARVSSRGGGGTAGGDASAGAGGGTGGSGATSGTSGGSGGTLSTPGRDASTGANQDAGTTPAGCPQGMGDCDGRTDNGCETNLDSDLGHCGKCDVLCPGLGLMSFGSTCNAGKCVLMCEAPFANCDGDLANGCESLGPCP